MGTWSVRNVKAPEPPAGRLGPTNAPATPRARTALPDASVAAPDSAPRPVAAIGFEKPERSEPPSRPPGWSATTPVNDKQLDLTPSKGIARELRK